MTDSNPPNRPAPSSPIKKIVFGLLLVAVVAALVLGGRQLGDAVLKFAAWVESLGVWGPIAFILGYALAAVAFAPGALLTLAAGVIFGLVKGTIYTFLGASLGAGLAFLIARYVARKPIERKIAGNPKFAAIDRAVSREGLKIVALLRLSPVVPFNLLNYALGLTRVRFLDYMLACFAMIPGTLLYVYYGKAAGSLAAVAGGGAGKSGGATQWISLAVGLLATIAVSTYIARLASRALRQEIEAGETATTSHPKTQENRS